MAGQWVVASVVIVAVIFCKLLRFETGKPMCAAKSGLASVVTAGCYEKIDVL